MNLLRINGSVNDPMPELDAYLTDLFAFFVNLFSFLRNWFKKN